MVETGHESNIVPISLCSPRTDLTMVVIHEYRTVSTTMLRVNAARGLPILSVSLATSVCSQLDEAVRSAALPCYPG